MKQLKLFFALLLLVSGRLLSTPIISAGSGNWSNPSTWVGGVVPTSGDIVTIVNGHAITVDVNASCLSLTIGNGALDLSTSISTGAGTSLNVTGTIRISTPAAGITTNMLDVNDGNITCTSVITANSTSDNLVSLVVINNGMLSCSNSFMMANNTTRNKLQFTGNGTLQISGNSSTIASAQFTAGTGTVDYSGTTGQGVLPLNYYTLRCSGAGLKALRGNISVTSDLMITGSSQLDVSASGNYSITLGGNWVVTSTNVNPFVERKGTVTFNGNTGIQSISTPLSQETFFNLIINNTAGNAIADVLFNKSVQANEEFSHIAGKTDLKGNRLIVASNNSSGGFVNCTLSGGSIISSVSGAQISFTDNLDSTIVNFTGTSIGSTSVSIPLTVNTGRINIENLSLYGTGSFTKTLRYDDIISKGGNKFYSTVSFTASATAGNWYMGAGTGALPDSFFARVDINSQSNAAGTRIIMGANSSGNYYADLVYFSCRNAGGISVGNNGGATVGTNSSHYFNNDVDVRLLGSGDMIFADGNSTNNASVTFNKILRLGSATGSTGSIFTGRNTTGSSITLTSTAQLTNGFIYGNTPVYLYNITQYGSLAQNFTNIAGSNSSIIVGGINGACTWNGSVNFTAPIIDLAYNQFNGSNNVFSLRNSTASISCTGGNNFATGAVAAFNNYSTSDWFIATTAADDYNGDVFYRINSTGAIYPAYNTNCTYAGNIVILPSSDSVIFAAAANGRVTVDGNANKYFTNNGAKAVSIKRLTINKTTASFTLNSHCYIPAGGDVTFIAGKLSTTSSAMLILMDETCTVTSTTAASTSYVDGPMRIDVSSSAAQLLHFPIGRNNECRPIDLRIQHSSSTSYSYTAEMNPSNANSLGWTNPASVYNVSAYRWWDITRTATATGIAASATELVTSPLPQVSFYYGLNDRAANPATVTLCKNTSTALTTWIDIGATGATNTIGKVTSVSSPSLFNSFSRFTLGFYGVPPAPVGRDSSRCGSGSAVITASPVYGEYIDWYATPTGGTALATNTTTFNTPVISGTTTFYAEARNTAGFVSATRTAVTATIYNTPVITGFTPATGDNGTTVVITGTNFNNNVTAVQFGGTAAASFTVNSSTQITAVVGAGSTGAVTVTNNCGSGSLAGFVYQPLTTWTGTVNTAWTNAGNWDDGVPTSVHTAVIPATANQPQITSNQTIKAIVLQNGAALNIAVGNRLFISGNFVNDGTVSGSGNIELNGTNTQILSGSGYCSNLRLNNSNGAVITAGSGNQLNITERYTPVAGVLTTNDNLVLKSNASQTGVILSGPAGGGYISGKVTLERYIPARRAWRLINFPITNASAPSFNTALQEGAGGNAASNPNPGYGTHITGGTAAAGFDQNATNSASMKEWISGNWTGISSTNNTISNQYPYFIFVRGSRANNLTAGTSAPADNTTLRVTANVNQGNQSASIAAAGWQLSGNPFPSKVNMDAVASASGGLINRNFMFWDPKLGGSNNVGGYVTVSYNGSGYDYTPAPVSNISEYAQPFAGFFVDANTSGTLTIAESSKCYCGTDNVFRPAPTAGVAKMHVNLRSVNSDGSTPVVDGTMCTFGAQYNNANDRFDVHKLNNSSAENIAVDYQQQRLSVNRRNISVTGNDTIQLYISNMKLRNYQLELNPENFDTTQYSIYIEDSYTGTKTPVVANASFSYGFSIVNTPAAYAANRFRVIVEKKDQLVYAVPINNTIRKKQTDKTTQAGTIRLAQNPVANNELKLKMTGIAAGKYTVSFIDNNGNEIAKRSYVHQGGSSLHIVNAGKQLPTGTLLVKIESNVMSGPVVFTVLVEQ